MWYAFKSWNQETQYGWTQNLAVAQAVEASLNRNRPEEQHYGLVPLGDDYSIEYQEGRKLVDYQGLLCDDDTTVEDIQNHDAEMDAEATA